MGNTIKHKLGCCLVHFILYIMAMNSLNKSFNCIVCVVVYSFSNAAFFIDPDNKPSSTISSCYLD